MRRVIVLTLALFFMVLFVSAEDYQDYTISESQDVARDISFTGGTAPRTFEIDNIFGSIKVTGYSGNAVKLTAKKTIRARTKETLENAKKEVKLDISNEKNQVCVMVDGPFRKEKNRCDWDIKKLGYIVQYDFTVQIPRKTAVTLKTVNGGDVILKDIEGKSALRNVNGKINVEKLVGDFDIHTVNGKIGMKGISGSGKAHTVNGKVETDFDKNPGSDCSFKTVNGNIEVTFPDKLSADFQVKTFNGNIYSDFNASYLPSAPAKGKRRNGKFVYKSSRFQGIRIGQGGPAIKMDTLNGNIYIKK